MLSATVASTHLFVSPRLSSQTLPVSSVAVWRRGGREQGKISAVAVSPLGFLDARRRFVRDSCWDKVVRRCGEGDYSALEAEVLEFMKKCEDPGLFPSKKQLIDAGRRDLVEGIVRHGGWMASGWDLEADESEEGDEILETESRDQEEKQDEVFCPASSLGSSLETDAKDESGVEAILSRLKRERNLNLGFKSPERKGVHPAYEEPSAASKILTAVVDTRKNSKAASAHHDNCGISISPGKTSHNQFTSVYGSENSLKPNDWRTWSAKRAGFPVEDFEAGISEESKTGVVDYLGSEALETVEGRSEHANGNKTGTCEIDLDTIRTRLKHMESEVSAILMALKSASSCVSSKASENSSEEELLKLYDSLEFLETEIMSKKDKLRSTRAKLAIVEGKLALTTIDAQRRVEERRKRVTKAMELLTTAYIVWTTTAEEVLLTGSFDGWATKRKMHKSKTSGVFSLYLKLYPGKYEIKFIVDGKWKVDPLRPTVGHKGYVNNVLVVY